MTVAGFSCKPVKKVMVIKEALKSKDTTQTVKLSELPKVDSQLLIRDLMAKVVQNKIDYNSFSAKVKLEYYGKDENQSATAYVKMKKDSIILLQIVGPLGIVGLTAKVTPDSIVLVNKIDKYVQRRSLAYVNESTNIPFDFKTLQDLIIGNPLFLNDHVVSFKTDKDKLLVLLVDEKFKNLITLDTVGYKPVHNKLDDADPLRNRTLDMSYGNYSNNGNIKFSTYRSISVAEKTKLDVYLDFKQYSFNEPLNFSFNIPKSYKSR